MYRAVHSVLEAHQDVWNVVPAFVSATDEFYEKLSLLIQLGQKQKVISTGITINKQLVINNSAIHTLKVANALKSYASSVEDLVLLEKVKVTRSMLLNGAHAVVLARMNQIVILAEENDAILGDFGILPEDLQALTDSLTTFQELIVAPRIAAVKRKQVTGQIVKVIKDLDELLHFRLDSLVKVIKSDNALFSSQFFNARIIIDVGTRSSGKGDPEKDDEFFGPGNVA